MFESTKSANEARERHMERIRKELAAFEKRELEIKAMERNERQMHLTKLKLAVARPVTRSVES